MLKRMRTLLAVLLVSWLAVAVASGSEAASALDQYRQAGTIVERYDGFVEVRGGDVPSDAVTLAEQVNAERRAIYAERAREQNVPIAAVGKLFAQKIAEKGAPSGTYFLLQDGSLVRK